MHNWGTLTLAPASGYNKTSVDVQCNVPVVHFEIFIRLLVIMAVGAQQFLCSAACKPDLRYWGLLQILLRFYVQPIQGSWRILLPANALWSVQVFLLLRIEDIFNHFPIGLIINSVIIILMVGSRATRCFCYCMVHVVKWELRFDLSNPLHFHLFLRIPASLSVFVFFPQCNK